MIDIDISSLIKDIEKKGAENKKKGAENKKNGVKKAKSDIENRQQEIAIVRQTTKNIEEKYYPLMMNLVKIHDSLRDNGFKCNGESGEFGRTNDDCCIKFMNFMGHLTWIELDVNHCKLGITGFNSFISFIVVVYKRSFTVTNLLNIIARPYVSKGKYKRFFKALKQGIEIFEQEFESFHDRYIQYAQSLLN